MSTKERRRGPERWPLNRKNSSALSSKIEFWNLGIQGFRNLE
jgi:hypothetical protein